MTKDNLHTKVDLENESPAFAKPVLYEVPTCLAGCSIGNENRKTKRKKAMGKYKCRFCGREMIATALSYQSNQYCNHCFNERADSTQKQNLNSFEFMGDKIELKIPNPKEKAVELVDKYRNYIVSFLSDAMKDKNAKICALIAVEEIISAIPTQPSKNESERIDAIMYWINVKQEIEKI